MNDWTTPVSIMFAIVALLVGLVGVPASIFSFECTPCAVFCGFVSLVFFGLSAFINSIDTSGGGASSRSDEESPNYGSSSSDDSTPSRPSGVPLGNLRIDSDSTGEYVSTPGGKHYISRVERTPEKSGVEIATGMLDDFFKPFEK